MTAHFILGNYSTMRKEGSLDMLNYGLYHTSLLLKNILAVT